MSDPASEQPPQVASQYVHPELAAGLADLDAQGTDTITRIERIRVGAQNDARIRCPMRPMKVVTITSLVRFTGVMVMPSVFDVKYRTRSTRITALMDEYKTRYGVQSFKREPDFNGSPVFKVCHFRTHDDILIHPSIKLFRHSVHITGARNSGQIMQLVELTRRLLTIVYDLPDAPPPLSLPTDADADADVDVKGGTDVGADADVDTDGTEWMDADGDLEGPLASPTIASPTIASPPVTKPPKPLLFTRVELQMLNAVFAIHSALHLTKIKEVMDAKCNPNRDTGLVAVQYETNRHAGLQCTFHMPPRCKTTMFIFMTGKVVFTGVSGVRYWSVMYMAYCMLIQVLLDDFPRLRIPGVASVGPNDDDDIEEIRIAMEHVQIASDARKSSKTRGQKRKIKIE
jgi:hypothetical protein